MVTYKIETNPHNLLGRWGVVAMLGNHLFWEVGRYADERTAHECLSRIHAMMRADAMTNWLRLHLNGKTAWDRN